MVEHSESIAKLSAALVKANAAVRNAVRDSTNPHFRSTYASLEAVLETVKPVYAAYGLTTLQMPGFVNGSATLVTRVLHESGEWIQFESGSPLQKNDPQGVGSAITYLRRYSLAGFAGIGQDDDDGNAASAKGSVGDAQRPPTPRTQGNATNEVLCPTCDSPMWDNRADKRSPKAPDFKCKADGDHAFWMGSWAKSLEVAADDALAAGALTEEEHGRLKAVATAEERDPVRISTAARWLRDKGAVAA